MTEGMSPRPSPWNGILITRMCLTCSIATRLHGYRDVSINNIERSLVQIEVELKRLGRNLLMRALQSGRPEGEARSLLGSVGLTGSSELLELYGWHDGTAMTGVVVADDIHLFSRFLSVVDRGPDPELRSVRDRRALGSGMIGTTQIHSTALELGARLTGNIAHLAYPSVDRRV